MKERILVADDQADILSTLRYLLEMEGFEVRTAGSPIEIEQRLREERFELLMMDLNYDQDTTSGEEGLELISAVRKWDQGLPIVVMTAWGSIEVAVKAIQRGAGDFVQKPWENDRLLSIVRNQIRLGKSERQTRRLTEENQLLRQQLEPESQPLQPRSAAMKELLEQLEKVAQSDASLLLTGENGTGKSLLARQVHRLSMRKGESFISVNMGSISEALFESEMFGHVKGAFTDARKDRIGRFELAEKGTLFLDEIGNTPLSQQVKLLRVLEERQFEKVGASHTQRTNCRLISATNGDLEEAVASGSFRRDLLYRINTVTLNVPALRERAEDVLPLARHFLDLFGRKYQKPSIELGEEASEFLRTYDWPGNIRELSHVVERAAILAKGPELEVVDLGFTESPSEGLGVHRADMMTRGTLEEIEKAVFEERLRVFDGNGMEAARSLDLSKSAFYRRLEKHRQERG